MKRMCLSICTVAVAAALLGPAICVVGEKVSHERELPKRLGLYAFEYDTELTRRIDAVYKPSDFTWINTAWAVMAIKQGMIPEKHVHQVTGAILEYWEKPERKYGGFSGLENYVANKHGQKVAGNLTMARTIPPMRQLFVARHRLMTS